MNVPRSRPPASIRAVLYALDYLPWPMGEEACALLFLLRDGLTPSRVRLAWRWCAVHPVPGESRVRSVINLFRFRGRFRATHALLGVRSPAALGERVRVEGQDRLPRSGGAILLGSHIGPPAVGEALIVAGCPVRQVAGARHSRTWSSEAWAEIRSASETFPLSEVSSALGGVLYRARRHVMNGERVYMTADGGRGRSAFQLCVPGAPAASIKAGWMALRRECGVPVFPVTSHLEGRIQVIEVHPALPERDADRQRDEVQCREAIERVWTAFADAYPAQCGGLLFPD